MRGIRDHALIVAHQHVGVMIFTMRNPCYRIHKRRGLVVILKRVGFADLFVLQLPSFNLLQKSRNFRARQRRYAAFTRFALLGS